MAAPAKKPAPSMPTTAADASTKNQALKSMEEGLKATSTVDSAAIQANQANYKTFVDFMSSVFKDGSSSPLADKLIQKAEAAFYETTKQNVNAMERSHLSLQGTIVAMAAIVGVSAYVIYQGAKQLQNKD